MPVFGTCHKTNMLITKYSWQRNITLICRNVLYIYKRNGKINLRGTSPKSEKYETHARSTPRKSDGRGSRQEIPHNYTDISCVTNITKYEQKGVPVDTKLHPFSSVGADVDKK